MTRFIIAALVGTATLLPTAVQASYQAGEMRNWKHPWGYTGFVSERQSGEWDSFAFDGPKGTEYMEVQCQTKNWKSWGFNTNVAGFHEAVLDAWCVNY